jgi:hypothetical protein
VGSAGGRGGGGSEVGGDGTFLEFGVPKCIQNCSLMFSSIAQMGFYYYVACLN